VKRKPKMHSLPLEHQLQIIGQRAKTRQINPRDGYLEVYPELLAGVQVLLPLDRQRLILAAHAVFGWMPTQLKVNMGQIDEAHVVLKRVLNNGSQITMNDLAFLASTFKTVKGNSVVAVSKVLHFLAPDHFPIWDRLVAKTWGLSPNGSSAATNYHRFIHACRTFISNPNGKSACNQLRGHLANSGYTYSMSDMRVIELIFFLSP